MEIRKLKREDIKSLIDFNIRIYPDKKVDLAKYVNFWLSKTESEYEKTLVVVDDNGQIVGQNFFSTMSYYWQGETVDSVWGFDLIVDEAYRKQTWGVDLLLACQKAEPQSLATGSGPDALKMNLKLGQKLLGTIIKYVGIINPWWIPCALSGTPTPAKDFPQRVKTEESVFEKIQSIQFPEKESPYNDNLLEISRKKNFLNWRYDNSLHEYSFYRDAKSENWFVVRTTIIKHIRVMILVDWRCNADKSIGFKEIVKACKKIANRLHISVMITGSTLSVFDSVLKENHFKSFGRPRPVIGRIKVKGFEEAVENRNFVFVTLGDSDGETNWI